MWGEFKEFVARGNVLDLAVGVIIGAAFGKIVTALTEDLIMPVIGAVFGGLDFSDRYAVLSGSVAPGTSLAEARKSGANVLAYGDFVSTVIDFAIIAFIIFLIVRAANRLRRPEPVVVAAPSEVELLAEIRDELRRRT
ncbi:large conductance mechanosensitive channel protein MscL [Parablastomonas sp. CN1-191]|uniref:large conductance mechanosensitive channel protein MscL n=1 Tax=Parablastomonas sp. CN1-191 TaxID=3400908 RepID=UPI003BF77B8D